MYEEQGVIWGPPLWKDHRLCLGTNHCTVIPLLRLVPLHLPHISNDCMVIPLTRLSKATYSFHTQDILALNTPYSLIHPFLTFPPHPDTRHSAFHPWTQADLWNSDLSSSSLALHILACLSLLERDAYGGVGRYREEGGMDLFFLFLWFFYL